MLYHAINCCEVEVVEDTYAGLVARLFTRLYYLTIHGFDCYAMPRITLQRFPSPCPDDHDLLA